MFTRQQWGTWAKTPLSGRVPCKRWDRTESRSHRPTCCVTLSSVYNSTVITGDKGFLFILRLFRLPLLNHSWEAEFWRILERINTSWKLTGITGRCFSLINDALHNHTSAEKKGTVSFSFTLSSLIVKLWANDGGIYYRHVQTLVGQKWHDDGLLLKSMKMYEKYASLYSYKSVWSTTHPWLSICLTFIFGASVCMCVCSSVPGNSILLTGRLVVIRGACL